MAYLESNRNEYQAECNRTSWDCPHQRVENGEATHRRDEQMVTGDAIRSGTCGQKMVVGVPDRTDTIDDFSQLHRRVSEKDPCESRDRSKASRIQQHIPYKNCIVPIRRHSGHNHTIWICIERCGHGEKLQLMAIKPTDPR
jgi:hypothetical protein